MSREGPLRFALAVAVFGVAAAALCASTRAAVPAKIRPLPTAGWETKAHNPNNPNYYEPDYPIVFVRAPLDEIVDPPMCRTLNPGYPFAGSVQCSTDTGNCTGGNQTIIQEPRHAGDNFHLGVDVVTAANPSVGNELWIYIPPYGQVKKLFPRAVHENQGLIDFSRTVGSVVEPSLSEDGTKVYFAYFQDATDANSTTQYLDKIPLSGADLYSLDLAPLLADPNYNLNNLTVTRLTTRTYVSPGSAVQLPADRDKDAMNETLATGTTLVNVNNYGTVYMHPTEVRTRDGLYLAYVSNKRRLDNSNAHMARANHNFNLHFAPILPDGTLGPEDNQFQYFTTTSALSPTPLREGLAFSYQATTEDARLWHIQRMDSEGRWGPLTGFGHGDQLYHLGSFCVADESGLKKDYFVSTKYYNVNNEGFGSIWKQDLSILGINTYDNPVNSMYVPRQVGATELTSVPGYSLSKDDPSPLDPTTGAYYGKLTSPRCGGVDELYFAYTPSSANERLFDLECSKGIYRSYIGFRDDLDPWIPGRTVANNGHYVVVKRTNDDYDLLWPVPVVPWSVRSDGDATQQYTADTATKKTPAILPGEPFAQVGTSALYNTDRRPPECYLVQPASGSPNQYHPWGTFNMNQENDSIMFNQDTWTWVTQGPGNDFCLPPPAAGILGIAVNLTGNKSNMGTFGYTNGAPNPSLPQGKEGARLLGVYDVRPQGNDQSFLAKIPANVPIEFHALDVTYGMKLADVRSWHSLKPRELRADCGGCHQHDVNGTAIPFAGTVAAGQPPVDFVTSTPSIGYDANCDVQVDPPDVLPAESYPEWRTDIWPLMDTYCGSCHNSVTGNHSGDAALSWASTGTAAGDQVYNDLQNRQFVSSRRGALGSQMFWAARSRRTDNRNNADPALQPDYDCSICGGNCGVDPCKKGKTRWGFYYSSAHDDLPVDCNDSNQAYADWVFKVGKWIDTHAPRDTGASYPYAFDWYHPTADSALTDATCQPTAMRVGWWDDRGRVASVAVTLNDSTSLYTSPPGTVANGSTTFGLPAVSNNDWITVEVHDEADNRQIYRKRVEQLIDECNLPDP